MKKNRRIKKGKKSVHRFISGIGVYGFDKFEPLIMACLVTEDPLLLIGPTGTGKTYLLNKLSEVLGLDHRHYNASLISFDDIVGFPYPDENKEKVKYMQTESTIWGAESVLIDEISRCKPESQNKLFSLIYEKRIQGIKLERLRYRWAAMNPCQDAQKQDYTDNYLGSEPLDQALADKFAMFIDSNPWTQLSKSDKCLVANPLGEGVINPLNNLLVKKISYWKAAFPKILHENLKLVTTYSMTVSDALNSSGISFSPRRTRQLSRNLAAVITVSEEIDEDLFLLTLKCSLPHKCWGFYPSLIKIKAAHHLAWRLASSELAPWTISFFTASSLSKKLSIFLENCPSAQEGTEVIAEMLSKSSPLIAYAFAFVVYPVAAAGKLKIGAEGVEKLGKMAAEMLEVKKELSFSNVVVPGKIPNLSEISSYCASIKEKARRDRARQFLYACLAKKLDLKEAILLEKEIEECVQIIRERKLV